MYIHDLVALGSSTGWLVKKKRNHSELFVGQAFLQISLVKLQQPKRLREADNKDIWKFLFYTLAIFKAEKWCKIYNTFCLF